MHVNVAGVSCSEIPPTSGLDPTNPMTSTKTKKDNSYLIGLCITVVLLVMMIIRYTILHHILQQIYSLYTYIYSFVAYLLFKGFKGKIHIRALVNAQKMTLSFLQEKEQEDEDLIVL